MAPKIHRFAAIFAVIALLLFVEAQGNDEEDMENLICSSDESTRESVLNCVSLLPKVHIEILKQCDARLANVAEDEYEKVLDIYCKDDAGFEGEQCVTDAYESRDMDPDEHIEPVLECIKGLIKK